MRTFKDNDLKTFEQLCRLRQTSLKKVMSNFLKKHYKKVVETKDYIFTQGEIPIALVAHLDTVFSFPPEEIFFDPRHNVVWSPQGLGADDRAGVFTIVQLVRSGLRPHIILTTDEERGAIGASKLAELDCPFKDLKYMIQLDRRGSDDCVFYDCDNEDFVTYIEKFGFTWNYGSFTDISVLCPSWGIAGVNLSVGYRDEHSECEVLFVGQLLATIDKVKNMLTQENIPSFKYIPAYHTKFFNIGYGYDTGNILKCSRCKQYFMEEEMFPVIALDNTTKFCCPDCLVDTVAWCNTCGSAFEKYSPEAPDTGTCPLCKKLEEGKNNGSNTKTV